MRTQRAVILISGRGSNMEAIVRASHAGPLRDLCEIVAVLSNRADASGLEAAEMLGVPTGVVPSKGLDTGAYGDRLLEALSVWSPDVVILAGFMRFVSSALVDAYPGRIVNIHPADTCSYQGPDGYGWAAAAGLDETYITVHLVDAGIDTGPILSQQAVDLRGLHTREEILSRGLAAEHGHYVRTLANLFNGQYQDVVEGFAGSEGGP